MIWLLALAAATAADPPQPPPATPVTMAQVQASPANWDSKWVRMTGWVGRCTRLDCALTEGPEGQGVRLSFEAADSFDRWVQPLVPAHVEVTARVDSTCLLELCIDRAPVLRQVFVRSLEAHRQEQ